jgi:ATP-dependent Clp protease ATP-binding subunit ClpA
MWNRFTARAQQAVYLAQEAGAREGVRDVRPDHLLRGLLEPADSEAARLLASMGIAPDDVLEALPRPDPSGEARTGVEMQLSSEAKRVIDHAYAETQRRRHAHIDSRHLLVGIAEGFGTRLRPWPYTERMPKPSAARGIRSRSRSRWSRSHRPPGTAWAPQRWWPLPD